MCDPSQFPRMLLIDLQDGTQNKEEGTDLVRGPRFSIHFEANELHRRKHHQFQPLRMSYVGPSLHERKKFQYAPHETENPSYYLFDTCISYHSYMYNICNWRFSGETET